MEKDILIVDINTYKEYACTAYRNFVSNKDVSGFKDMIDYINSNNPNLVIDAGCGNNIFKQHIKNIKGFDVREVEEADYIGTYHDMNNIFKENSADFVISLGSLGFGPQEIIQQNLEYIYKWLKPQGMAFIIELPDNIATDKDKKNFPLKYFWNEDKINYFTGILGFDLYSKPLYNLGKLNWVWQK